MSEHGLKKTLKLVAISQTGELFHTDVYVLYA